MTDATVVTLDPKPSTSTNVGVAVTFEVRLRGLTRATNVTSAGQDVSYSLTKRTLRGRKVITLLEDISGFLQPGTLTALLGPSGCGKTTLLDVLAGRKTQGTIEGSVLYAGEVPSQTFMRRHTGYCEQQGMLSQYCPQTVLVHLSADTLIGTLTPYEMLCYTAYLKLPLSMSKTEKMQRVDTLIDVLGLTGCRNTKIGTSLTRGISGGQVGVTDSCCCAGLQ